MWSIAGVPIYGATSSHQPCISVMLVSAATPNSVAILQNGKLCGMPKWMPPVEFDRLADDQSKPERYRTTRGAPATLCSLPGGLAD
jgi:hypothetical protein